MIGEVGVRELTKYFEARVREVHDAFPGDPLATEWVERLSAIEDQLILEGRLAHDFAVIIARKPVEAFR